MTTVCQALRVLVGLLLVVLVAVVAMSIFYRYALGDSLYWATEVPNFLMIWIVFLGSVVAYHEHKHIAFTLLGDKLGGRIQAMIECVGLVVVLALLLVMIYYGVLVVDETMNSVSEALRIPKGYIYSCLPISAVLMMISTVEQLYASARRLGS